MSAFHPCSRLLSASLWRNLTNATSFLKCWSRIELRSLGRRFGGRVETERRKGYERRIFNTIQPSVGSIQHDE